jgi:hypothetical protein
MGTCVVYGTLVLGTQRGIVANISVISIRKLGQQRANDAVPASAVRKKRLRLFGITKTGLLAMAISVLALWSCIAIETAALRRAALDARVSFRTLERLRQQSVPASEPAPPFHRQSVKSS